MYIEQPPSLLDKHHPNYVCNLNSYLSGLKQASRAWFECPSKELVNFGFYRNKVDSSLFILRSSSTLILTLSYVDDVIITGNNQEIIKSIIRTFSCCFSLKDLGKLSYFLGIKVGTSNHGVCLTQAKYTRDLFAKTHMDQCSPSATPMAIKPC